MNSWDKLTHTIANDQSELMPNCKDVNRYFITELATIQSKLNDSLLSESTQKRQKASSRNPPIELTQLTQLQNQLVTANINGCSKAFSQFLTISSSYRNRTHQMTEESLLALGDGTRG